MVPKLFVLETSTHLRHLSKLWNQLDIKCTLSVLLYLWGVKTPFVGNWVEIELEIESSLFGSNGPIYIFNLIFCTPIFFGSVLFLFFFEEKYCFFIVLIYFHFYFFCWLLIGSYGQFFLVQYASLNFVNSPTQEMF